MADRTVQLVLQYDGADFSGWQRQPEQRTVQGVVEEALQRLCDRPISALGSGRTDAGVHARGQAVGVIVPARWESAQLRRALNAVLPSDVWVAKAFDMRPEFHARYSAAWRRYSYLIGTDDEANGPFRRRYELGYKRSLNRAALDAAAGRVTRDHCFRPFAAYGTGTETNDQQGTVTGSRRHHQPRGLVFVVQANRFLHNMGRFLVGAMLGIGAGPRPVRDIPALPTP